MSRYLKALLLTVLILAVAPSPRAPFASFVPAVAEIMDKMAQVYEKMPGYRAEIIVREYAGGALAQEKTFLYTFKKPDSFRIDMHSPHGGAVLIRSPKDGKVVVRPGTLGGIFKLRLSPDNSLLKSPSGQRIDQTDLGLLIGNLRRSFTDRRRSEVQVEQGEGWIVLQALAQDHFLPGVLTRYRLKVDSARWLPVEMHEYTAEGELKRSVTFSGVQSISCFPEHFFDTEGKPAAAGDDHDR